MKGKFGSYKALLLMLLLSVSIFAFFQPRVNINANVATGDEILYTLVESQSFSHEEQLMADADPSINNYWTLDNSSLNLERLMSMLIVNTSSTYVYSYVVLGANWRTDYFTQSLRFNWNGDWVVDYNNTYVDDKKEIMDATTYFDAYFLDSYPELAYDNLRAFSMADYYGNETINESINGHLVEITTDVYYALDKPNEIGYQNYWTEYLWGVDINVTETMWFEYYWYVDPVTDIPVKMIGSSFRTLYKSFDGYSPYFGCNITYFNSETEIITQEISLDKATNHYSPYANDAFLAYSQVTYPNGEEINNSTNYLEINFQFYEQDEFTIKIYYENLEFQAYMLIDTFEVSGVYNYTYMLDVTNLPYHRGYEQNLKIEISDSLSKQTVYSYISDKRIIVPDWESWIYIRDSFNGALYSDIYAFDCKIFSDTYWNISSKFYYGTGQNDYYTYFNEGFGNATMDIYLGYADNLTAYQTYTAELYFIDAVGTSYNKTIEITFYPAGTDYMPPYLEDSTTIHYVLGPSTYTYYFSIEDENDYTYYIYKDGTQIGSGSGNGYQYITLDFAVIFDTSGVYNLTILATDGMGNTRSMTYWVIVYPEGYDVFEPSLYFNNLNYYYPIGRNDWFEIDFYDDNPDYYEIRIDGTIVDSGHYWNGFVRRLYLMDFISTNGFHSIYAYANDSYGNEHSEVYTIEAYIEEPEYEPPVITGPSSMTVEVGVEAYLQFSLYEDYPTVFNVYMNGTPIMENVTYRGDDSPSSTYYLNILDYCSTTGLYQFEIEAFDYWGNVGVFNVDVNIVNDLLDNTPPAITVDAPTDIYYIINTDFWITYTLEDQNPSFYRIFLNNLEILNGTYTEQYDISLNLFDLIHNLGNYTLTIEAYDLAGNFNSFSVYIYASDVMDVDPPFIDCSTKSYIEYELGTDYNIEFSLYDENPDRFEILIDNVVVYSENYYDGFSSSISLSDYIFDTGMHYLEIHAWDTYGNDAWYSITIKAVSTTTSTDTGTGTGTQTSETSNEGEQTISLPFNFLYSLIALLPLGLRLRKKQK